MVVNLKVSKASARAHPPPALTLYGQQAGHTRLCRGLLLHEQADVTPLSKFLPTPLNMVHYYVLIYSTYYIAYCFNVVLFVVIVNLTFIAGFFHTWRLVGQTVSSTRWHKYVLLIRVSPC